MKMKKRIYFTLFLIIAGLTGTYAQSLNFGIKGGANFSNFQGSNANFKTESISSYHAGAFIDLGVSQKFSIQPEILYSTIGAKVSLAGAVDEFRNKLGYISIPVLAKLYLIPNRLSIDLGPQVSFLLNEKENVNLEKSNSYDFSVAGGVTLRVLGPIFVQGRYNLGLNDVKPNAGVNNRVFQLSAGLRF
jgi:hypothetical protein